MTAPVSISWAIEALVASTVLMVVVLVLRGPVRRAFGAQIAYALWLLPVLRLVLPPLPESWSAAAVAAAPVQQATQQMTEFFVMPAAETTAPVVSLIGPALAALWLAGAAAFVAWHSYRHRRFCKQLLLQASAEVEQDGVHIIETEAASGPLAFGVWRRYIAFPRDFAERYEPEERDLALAHELGHHARGDLIANWIALVVLALHWFNPIAWRAFRAFRADQEIANDARVLAGLNPMRRHSYACAILKAAHPSFLGGTVSATCHLHTIDDLKGRLRMLTTTKTSRTRLAAGAGVLSLCVAAGLGLTASGTAAATKMRSTVEDATGVDLTSLDQSVAATLARAAMQSEDTAAPAARAPSGPKATPEVPQTPEPPLPPSRVSPESPATPETPMPPEASGRAPGEARTTTTTVMVTKDGKRIVRYGRYVKLNRDGSYTVVGEIGPMAKLPAIPPMPATPPMPRMPAMPPMPEITSRSCGPVGADGKMVIKEQYAGGKRIIICNDRIATAAAKGAQMAANSANIERNAYAQALNGLRDARARMMSSTDMSAEARKHALEGIDTAIKEVESDLARVK